MSQKLITLNRKCNKKQASVELKRFRYLKSSIINGEFSHELLRSLCNITHKNVKILLKSVLFVYFQRFHDGGSYHIEISPLIFFANQCTAFNIIETFFMKELAVCSSPEFLFEVWKCINSFVMDVHIIQKPNHSFAEQINGLSTSDSWLWFDIHRFPVII